MSQALHLTGGDEVSETAHFIGMMDRFFDALNVHKFSHGSKALKPFQLPYTSATDFRLKVCQYSICIVILYLQYTISDFEVAQGHFSVLS